MNKICFKCSNSKPLNNFYAHAKMADGHLNKCKACTKKDTAQREARMANDPVWREKELERHRIKAAKYRAEGRKPNAEAMRAAKEKYNKTNRLKRQAQAKALRAQKRGILVAKPCEICGSTNRIQGHHHDYLKPLEVIWLCPKHHGEKHVEINKTRRLQQG